AGGQERAQEADQRLQGDDQVGGDPDRRDLAVADGGEGLDAEEEALEEPGAEPGLLNAGQGARPEGEEDGAEEGVRPQKGGDDEAQEARPGDGQEVVVGAPGGEEPEPLADDVEAAVPVEQALGALAGDDGAEPEVPVELLPFPLPFRRHGRLAIPRRQSGGSGSSRR